MIIFKSILLIFLFFSLLNTSYASSYKEPQVPDDIEIFLGKSTFKYYKLLKGALKNKTHGIGYNYKKNVNGFVIFNKNNTRMKVKAKIRILGDWHDHLTNGYSSIKIKMSSGNIGGITRFRLLLPETRNGEDEIFWSVLMQEIGFLSPYRKMINVYFNKKFKYKAIFDETASKEFIERNLYRESPIIEYEERTVFDNSFIARIKGCNKLYPMKQCDKTKDIHYLYQNVIDNSNFIKNMTNFKTAMIATSNLISSENDDYFFALNSKYAPHGLASHNRKFLFDPIYNIYHPIYFDGMVNFKDCKINTFNDTFILKHNLNKYYKIMSQYKLRTKKTANIYQKCVLKEILNNLAPKEIQVKIKALYPKIFNKSKFIAYKKLLPNIVSIDHKTLVGKKCNWNLKSKDIDNCLRLKKDELFKMISGDSKPEKYHGYRLYPFLAGYQNYKNEYFIKDLNVDRTTANILIPKNFTFFLKIKENVKNLNIKLQNKYTSKVVIYKSKLNNLKLNIENEENNNFEIKNFTKSDQRLLTGCLTIIDSKINNSIFEAKNLQCEDSINFIRTVGSIENIKVMNAKYDAIDFDFSKIDIKKIQVTNAGNDCLDFSSGSYNILKANLNLCGDKGLSVGEESYLTAKDIKVNGANIGVAVKDQSIVHLNNFTANDKLTNTCFSVYQKKQEYGSSKLYYNYSYSCNKFNISDLSKIVKVKKEKLCNYIKNFKLFKICLTNKILTIEVKKIYSDLYNNEEKEFKVMVKKNNNDNKFNLKLISNRCKKESINCVFNYNLPKDFQYIYISNFSKNYGLIESWTLESSLF